jgi:hypothetical protein
MLMDFAEGMVNEQIPIRRHRVSDVHFYDVTADELNQIETDSAAIGTDLNFALVSAGIFATFLLTLSTAKVDSDRIFAVYVAIMVVLAIASIFFGVRWWGASRRGLGVIQGKAGG